MGFRFRKSVKNAPGVRLNIGKKSVGISAGVKGARVSVNSKGRVTKTVGLPGTGISYTDVSTVGKKKSAHISSMNALEQIEPNDTPIDNIPSIEPQSPWQAPQWVLVFFKVCCIILITMSLTLSTVRPLFAFIIGVIGYMGFRFRRLLIIQNGGKVPRRRWVIIVSICFILLAMYGASISA